MQFGEFVLQNFSLHLHPVLRHLDIPQVLHLIHVGVAVVCKLDGNVGLVKGVLRAVNDPIAALANFVVYKVAIDSSMLHGLQYFHHK